MPDLWSVSAMLSSEDVGHGASLPPSHHGNLHTYQEKMEQGGSESPVLPPCGNGAQGQFEGPAPRVRTFLDDVDDVVGVEAELVGVLRVVGIERPALRHLRLGLGLRLGPPSGRGRAARGLPADTAQQGLVGFGAQT